MTARWESVESAIEGELVLPDSPGYDAARTPPIVRFQDVRPAAVVRCASAEDVRAAIGFARANGLPTAARSGGHCFAGRSSTSGIVIDVSPMNAVRVKGDVARIGAGARLGDVYDELDRHGVTIPAGCGTDVGIAGLVLGGGLGIMGRAYGLTADSLLSAEVVLADGRIVEADDDLLWALRGAGHGGFGVATSFTFRTYPAPPATAFDLRFPPEQAAELIAAWQAWAPDAPDTLAASLLITAAPDPTEPLDVKVFGAMLASEAETEAELARLPAEPIDATLRHGSYRETKRHLAGAGGDEAPMALYSRSEFFERPLPPEAIEALTGQLTADRRPGEARELDFSPWAGAYGRVAPDETAFPHRSARFLLKQTAATSSGGDGAAAAAWATGAWTLTRPHGTGGVYPNFPDPELEDPGRAYYGANLERLLAIKAAYDPGGAFPFP